MISAEAIANKILTLPPASQKQVLDYIDSLVARPIRLTPGEKVSELKKMFARHSHNGAVILDDSREVLYED